MSTISNFPHELDGSSTALAAVALQDHLMKNLSLSSTTGLRKAPVHRLPEWKKNAKSTLDTGRGKPRKKSEINLDPVEKEYVLDAKPPPMSLAQRFGLVEAPGQLLTEEQWSEVKARSNQRDDFKEACVICKEDLGAQQQVLLSCTHVFHKACLQAFERFTGKKCCPMCRKEQYQTRVVHDGTKYHRHKCATRIQALWRGYVVRCWYLKLRETMPPQDPRLRRIFYEQRFADITERMVRSLDCDVDGFLREIDRSVQASRDVFRQFDDKTRQISDTEWDNIQLKAVERGEVDCPICLTPLQGQSYVAMPTCTPGDQEHCNSDQIFTDAKKSLKTPTRSQLRRTGPPKPISKSRTSNKSKLENSQHNDSHGKSSHAESRHGDSCHGGKQSVLLSCSHVFHFTCLQAFEEFAVGDRKHVCPVCRSHYQKRVLTTNDGSA